MKARITFVSRDKANGIRPRHPWAPEFLAAIEQTAQNGRAVEYTTADPVITGARILQSLYNRYMRRRLQLHVRTLEKGRYLVWCDRITEE